MNPKDKQWSRDIPDRPIEMLVSTTVVVHLDPKSRWFHYEVQQSGQTYAYEITRLTFHLSNGPAVTMMGERIYQSGSRTQPQHLYGVTDEELEHFKKIRKAILPKVIADVRSDS
jgi:hypothetical protein